MNFHYGLGIAKLPDTFATKPLSAQGGAAQNVKAEAPGAAATPAESVELSGGVNAQPVLTGPGEAAAVTNPVVAQETLSNTAGPAASTAPTASAAPTFLTMEPPSLTLVEAAHDTLQARKMQEWLQKETQLMQLRQSQQVRQLMDSMRLTLESVVPATLAARQADQARHREAILKLL